VDGRGEERTLTEEEADNMIAWRQGLFYKLLIPHGFVNGVPQFNQDDLRTTNKPVGGVPYAEGLMSAYKSFIARGKKFPDEVKLDMGAVDITIKSVGNKVKIGFARDTRYDISGKKKPRRTKVIAPNDERFTGIT